MAFILGSLLLASKHCRDLCVYGGMKSKELSLQDGYAVGAYKPLQRWLPRSVRAVEDDREVLFIAESDMEAKCRSRWRVQVMGIA